MVIEVYKRATSADWATARLTSRATTQGARLTDWRTDWLTCALAACYWSTWSGVFACLFPWKANTNYRHGKLATTTRTIWNPKRAWGTRHEACTLAQGRKCFTCVLLLLLLLPTDNFVCITFVCSTCCCCCNCNSSGGQCDVGGTAVPVTVFPFQGNFPRNH